MIFVLFVYLKRISADLRFDIWRTVINENVPARAHAPQTPSIWMKIEECIVMDFFLLFIFCAIYQTTQMCVVCAAHTYSPWIFIYSWFCQGVCAWSSNIAIKFMNKFISVNHEQKVDRVCVCKVPIKSINKEKTLRSDVRIWGMEKKIREANPWLIECIH